MNLEEVARLAGVSRSTVSRVLNGDRRVSEGTRARVQAVVREHHYHPHAAARSLASRRTRILGLLIPQAVGSLLSEPFFPHLIHGVADACNAADHLLALLMDTSEDPAGVERLYRRATRGRHLDGVVISSSAIDNPLVAQLRQDGFPCVLVGRHPHHPMSYVDIPERESAQTAVAHLLAHGYRRIAMINGPAASIPALDRHAGYVAAHAAAGLAPDPAQTVTADFTRRGGYRAMRALLGQPAARPDAVFAASDAAAFGAIRALQEAGLRVPWDVAVMGFDGLEEDSLAQFSLSTVAQPVAELGREAVRALLRVIADPPPEPIQVVLPTALTLRRSCGCVEPEVLDGAPGGSASEWEFAPVRS